MIPRLTNPFRYLAGGGALTLGLAAILATSVVGYYSGTNFPDVLSVKVGYNEPFYAGLIHNLSSWIALGSILYIASLIFSKSSVRAVDIFGTQALARFPYLIAATTGFSNAPIAFSNYMLWKTLKVGTPTSISSGEIAIAILILAGTIILTIWQVVLMYNAFKESSNIKGGKSIILFAVSLIMATVASAYLAHGAIGLVSA